MAINQAGVDDVTDPIRTIFEPPLLRMRMRVLMHGAEVAVR